MNTALNDSRTEASGWLTGSIVGCTRTATPFSSSSAIARSFTVYPRSRADAMSASVSSLIPSRYTSPATTRAPNAIVAMIAALAAASNPSTSAVGSRSAYPRLCASASASVNDAPDSDIRVRM